MHVESMPYYKNWIPLPFACSAKLPNVFSEQLLDIAKKLSITISTLIGYATRAKMHVHYDFPHRNYVSRPSHYKIQGRIHSQPESWPSHNKSRPQKMNTTARWRHRLISPILRHTCAWYCRTRGSSNAPTTVLHRCKFSGIQPTSLNVWQTH